MKTREKTLPKTLLKTLSRIKTLTLERYNDDRSIKPIKNFTLLLLYFIAINGLFVCLFACLLVCLLVGFIAFFQEIAILIVSGGKKDCQNHNAILSISSRGCVYLSVYVCV